MEFYEVVKARRSIRQFEDKPIPREVLERILDAGLKAPSSNHQRRWELLDKDLKAFAAKTGLDYVTNDDSMSRPFDAPPVMVNFFYHSEIKRSARKGGVVHA